MTGNYGKRLEDMTPEEQKHLFKAALQEWLDAKYAEFGKWTARGVAAMALAALIAYAVAHGGQVQDFAKWR